ncbi:hypothetical protein [Bacillus cereus]|uniref:hypothetical protein n=1 Tax=Bacillus cereus TaxID=1396 RepID=UPI0027DBBE7B|nr:hypothetical protein [Bacillus cereus]
MAEGMVLLVMRKFPANSFVTRSQFGFGGGGGGQGSGQIIDKGAKQPIFFLFFNTTPPRILYLSSISSLDLPLILMRDQ